MEDGDVREGPGRTATIIVGAVIAAALIFGAGFCTALRMSSTTPDLTDEYNWRLVRSFHGVIDPAEGPAHARISFFSEAGDRFGDSDYVLQNRIELMSGGRTSRFMWPTNEDVAATWAEIEDLDGDGTREFILIANGFLVRVVSYAGGHFTFRERTDEQISAGGDVDVLDINGDQRSEFVIWSALTDTLTPPAREGKYGPHMEVWTRERGFERAPALDEAYRRYRATLPPVGR